MSIGQNNYSHAKNKLRCNLLYLHFLDQSVESNAILPPIGRAAFC